MNIDRSLGARAATVLLVSLAVVACGGGAEAGDTAPANEAEAGFTRVINVEVSRITSETFVDNASANEMLTRKYRKPFVVPEAGKV